jgi:hypothetical protein
MANFDLYLEAERRGILPPDKAALLNEARSRGLVPGAPGLPQDQMPEPRMTLGQQAMQFVRPTIEAVGTGLGAIAGTPLGPLGTVAGAGLGYGITQEGLRLAEETLGYREPRTGAALFTEPARDVLEGATFEAGGRAILGPVIEAGARGLSRVGGALSDIRDIPLQRAARAARESLTGGPTAPTTRGRMEAAARTAEARAALQARPDLLPGQALAEGGMVQPTTQAMLQRMGAQAPEATMNMLNAQDAVRLNQLAVIAGGADQTAARAAREEARTILNRVMIPQLEIEMGAANIAGQQLPRLQGQAIRFGEAAGQKVEDVRRFTAAAERARGAQVTPVPGQPRVSAQITYYDDLARAADEVSEQAARGSLAFGEASRFAQAAANSLEAHGLKPLKSADVIRNIDARLRDVKTVPGNKPLQDIMTQVRDDIARWTDSNGVIDAWALENIRKNALTSYITTVPAGAEAAEKVAKQAAGKVKDLVADAIEGAGGTGYRAYLDAYSKGAQKISQTELGAQALRLYESAPRTFVKLIEGNDPKLIERIFGPGSYDVAKEMSEEALGRLKGIAAEVKRDREVATQAKAGQERLAALMKEYGVDLSLPNVFNIVATTGNKILGGLSKRINKATLDTLIEASKDAKSFDELLATVPASERSKILQYLNDPTQWTTVRRVTPAAGAFAIGATSSLRAPEYNNMLAPEPAQNMLMVP